MSIRVLINGAFGRMGQLTVKALSNTSDLELVAKTGRQDDLADIILEKKVQVVVDLTNAESVLRNTQVIIDAGAHPVIGTSGLMKEHIKTLQLQCEKKKLGGIIAPNFSLGAVLMMKYVREISRYFPYSEIIEMHHAGKKDSPSGTSIRTAELIAESRSEIPSLPEELRQTIPGARGASYQHIPIHSVRLPGLIAHQQVLFGGTGETLTLKHDSIDRECFMAGILLACRKVIHLDRLVYGLEELI